MLERSQREEGAWRELMGLCAITMKLPTPVARPLAPRAPRAPPPAAGAGHREGRGPKVQPFPEGLGARTGVGRLKARYSFKCPMAYDPIQYAFLFFLNNFSSSASPSWASGSAPGSTAVAGKASLANVFFYSASCYKSAVVYSALLNAKGPNPGTLDD